MAFVLLNSTMRSQFQLFPILRNLPSVLPLHMTEFLCPYFKLPTGSQSALLLNQPHLQPAPALFSSVTSSSRLSKSSSLAVPLHPALFTAAVEVVPDLVEQPGGEVETPIHNALNWQYSRFGHQVRDSLYGAILRNEDGSCWQVKLSQPLQDKRKDRLRKYETPMWAMAPEPSYLPSPPKSNSVSPSAMA